MPYIITSDTVGLAIGPASETESNVHEALSKARQMYETGLAKPFNSRRGRTKNRQRRSVRLHYRQEKDHQRPTNNIGRLHETVRIGTKVASYQAPLSCSEEGICFLLKRGGLRVVGRQLMRGGKLRQEEGALS